ncbi:competence protein ComEC [Halopseudomonas sabulinigri]|uniref:Competence protein ComEC n=1 Tax=Halopseudomonas sabulinigri TaxID=472181 RepID=A0A1H1NYU2_9GAMM|nr:competence protein ComEC [Halopseudomonas sabulinigri]
MSDLRLLLASLLAGLLLPLCFSQLPSLGWLVPLLPAALLLWRVGAAGRCLCFLLCGLVWALIFHHQAIAQRLDQALDGHTVQIEGRIAGLPEQTETGRRFQLESVRRQDSGETLPSLRLHWWGGEPVAAGELWSFETRLRRPRGLSNPGSFDYEAWLYAAGTGGLGSVRGGERVSASASASWREALRARFSAALAPVPEGQRLLALVLGDKSSLSDSDWEVLQATGTSHLMVISGLHVGMLALTVFWLTRQLLRWGRFAWAWPQLWLSAPVALAAAAVYAALSGFAVPVQRALLMCALACCMQLWQRRPSPLLIWLAALVVVVALNPAAPLRAGFWLSFMAVGLLIFGLSGRLALQGVWARWGSAQWVVYLGLWPWLVLWGMPSSASALLVNLVAIPCLSVFLLPLALLGALVELLTGWPLLLQYAAGALGLLFNGLTWVAGFSPLVHFAFPGWLGWLCALAGSLMLLSPLSRLLWLPAGLCLLPLLLPQFARPDQGELQLTVLDVGQGLAIHVQTAEHDLLYDAGARLSSGFDLGEAVVLPALLASGVTRLDMLLISHADNDHAGGALAVQQRLPVERVISGEPERLAAGLVAEPCRAQRWTWDGVTFELLPGAQQQAASNDRSCVLQLSAGQSGVLLPGDIRQAGEYHLLPALRRASVLLAPHHGSVSSSSYAFIRQVAPRWVVYSAGASNRYGHPHPKVVARYRELSVEPVYTAVSGAVRFRLDGQVEPELTWHWREKARRFWHEQ